MEVLRFKALMGKAGVRQVAANFNRLHGGQVTVGKTFVAELLITHQHELALLRRELRNKPPPPYPVNAIWAMDLTFYTDKSGITHPILGILDHGSRLVTCLQVVVNRKAWTLLGHLCLAIGKHGKPRALRTDNEIVFKSFAFKTLLKLLGIRRQCTQVCAPWQNGRIERLFGTLKPLLRQLVIPSSMALGDALSEFTLFYNHCRPHQALGGLTPADALQGRNWNNFTKFSTEDFESVGALDGLLFGYHLRR